MGGVSYLLDILCLAQAETLANYRLDDRGLKVSKSVADAHKQKMETPHHLEVPHRCEVLQLGCTEGISRQSAWSLAVLVRSQVTEYPVVP